MLAHQNVFCPIQQTYDESQQVYTPNGERPLSMVEFPIGKVREKEAALNSKECAGPGEN